MPSATRRFFGLGLAVATLCPAMAGAAEPGPAEVLAAIYRRAAAGKGDSGGQFIWFNRKDRRTHFTRRTADLWERAEKATAKGDQAPPGFDPVTSSQDPDLKSFEFVSEEDGAERARILVRLTSRQEPGKPYASLRYELQRESGRWMIDDIANTTAGEEAWSLRKLLETHLAEARRAR